MPDPSAGEVGGVFAGIVALLYALGRAAGWLLNWKDHREETRSAKLQAWHEELERREKDLERKQTEHWQRIEKQLAQLRIESAALRGGYQLIAGALRLIDPDNPALRQGDELLKTAFPLDPLLPADMQVLISQITGPDEDPRASA